MMKIRVISPILGESGPDAIDARAQARISAAALIPAEISFAYIHQGPRSIESKYEDALAVPGTVEAAIQAEREGMDAVVINCSADTGLEACREALNIPVVGPSQAAMHLAAQLTHRFSVLSLLERVNQRFEEMAWNWGLAHKLASVRAVEVPLLDLSDNADGLVQKLFETGMRCIEQDGAHGLILGCTDFEDLIHPLQDKFRAANNPIVLFQPYLIAVHQAYMLVSMGILQSKLSYPCPKWS
jgi:allantoin racemase